MATQLKTRARAKPARKPVARTTRRAAPVEAGPAPMKLKLIRIGTSTGVVMPKALLDRLKVARGDHLFVVDAPQGVNLSAVDREFEAQMTAARAIMRRRRAVLRELAK